MLVSLPLYPVAFVGSRLMDAPCLGRKGASTLYFTCLALALGTAALLPQYAIGASMVANFFALAAFNLVYVQAAELYPTSVRSTATGFLSAVSRLATLVATFGHRFGLDFGHPAETRRSRSKSVTACGDACICCCSLFLCA